MATKQNHSRGAAVHLTRKEKELLELLENHPGRCLSKAFLLAHIWGYTAEVRTSTLEVHVSRLRRKLRGRRDVEIHAVVRQGYVLEVRTPENHTGLAGDCGAGSLRRP